MTQAEGFAEPAAVVEIDTDAYHLLGENGTIKVPHTDGSCIIIRVHERIENGNKPDDRGVN